MGRAQQLYMRVNATNEPAPLGNVDDNDAYVAFFPQCVFVTFGAATTAMSRLRRPTSISL